MLGRAIIFFIGVLASTTTVGDDPSPEVAYVSTPRGLLRSGPGNEFFPTDRVPWGTRLEVYHEVDSGWCAVRPLSQSFSWVLADAIATTDEDPGIGRVVGEDATARIGSNISDDRDVECVTLTPGESVQILGSETRSGDGDPTRWLKISPPAGEFRWIRRDSLQKTPPHFEHGSHETQPPETAVLPRISVDLEDLQEPQALAVRLTGGTEESPAAWRAVRSDARPINDNNAEPDRFQDPPVDLLSDAAIPSPPHLPGDIASPSHQPVGADFSHQTLELIQAELETMLRGSTRLWSFDELIAKTQEIASGTDVPEIQSESLELLGTLDRLEKIRRRHQQLITSTAGSTLASASSGTRPRPESADGAVGLEKAIRLARDRFAPYRPSAAPGQSLPTTASRTAGIAGIRGASDGTRSAYDGSGWLTTVHSTRQGAPQYALTDSDGRIFQLVEPQPGLNLRPYLRQQVGLIGRQSYAADLQKPVLTAERVVVINRR